MDKEPLTFGLLTVGVITGSAILVAGSTLDQMTAMESLGMTAIGIGSAVMVLGILVLAAYISMLPEPAHHEEEAEHGH